MSQQINLFNPIFLKQKKYFSALTMVQALGIILAGILVISGYSRFQLTELDRQVEASNLQVASAQKQLDEFKAQTGGRQKSKTLERDVQRAEADLKALQLALDVLRKGEFGDTKGFSEYLRAFSRQIINGVWLTGFSIAGAGAEISLQGRALQPDLVPAYIKRLRNEPVMRGKSFAALEMQVPQVDQVNPADKEKPATTNRVAAKFIEFSLQSSPRGAEKEQMDLPGATK